MQLVPGQPLGKWLDARQGQVPNPQEGVALATRIVGEVGRALGLTGRTHLHRDCNPRNCLVIDGPDGPECWLIDFGAAVETGLWRAEWANRPPAGDVRYWAPSAWVRFMHGPGALMQAGPAWVDQYAAQIDAYALGILGVEVLCALLPDQAPWNRLVQAWANYRDYAHQAWAQCHVFGVKHVFGPAAAGDPASPAHAEWQRLEALQVPPRLTALATELRRQLEWLASAKGPAALLCG